MSLQRIATPSFASIVHGTSLRFPPQPSQTLRVCTRCLRFIHRHSNNIPQRHSPQPPSRRFQQRLFTSTALQAQHAEAHQPPRNAGVPDTSIAGGKAGVDFTIHQQDTAQTAQFPPNPQPANAGVPESEAQKSRPVSQDGTTTSNSSNPFEQGRAVGRVAAEVVADTSSASPGASSTTGTKRKSKLRPRKAALTLSSTAVEQLRGLLDQPEPKLIRVGVKNRGCSGLAYHLEYVEKAGPFDEAVDQDGVRVLVDSKALFSIIGSEMDWVEDKLSRRFIFKNPNITEQCGCGESFSVSS